MVLELIFGFLILTIAVFIAVRILGNVTLGVALIALVLLASYLILGSFPDLKSIPLIGQYIPKLPKTTGGVIAIMKNVLYKIDILPISRDSENNLLIAVANTGKLEVSGFRVSVNGQDVMMMNSPKQPLKSGEITILQVGWKEDFDSMLVQTDQINVSASKE